MSYAISNFVCVKLFIFILRMYYIKNQVIAKWIIIYTYTKIIFNRLQSSS